MRTIVALLCCLVVAPARAQQLDCTPQRVQGHSGWATNTAVAYGAWVPPGEIWLLKTAGVVTNDPTPLEYKLQIEQEVLSQGNACCWLQPLVSVGRTEATPKLALDRPVILEAGERLAARTHATVVDLALLYSGWKFPSACLGRLLGVASASPGLAPDFSATAAAATDAASALTKLAKSLP